MSASRRNEIIQALELWGKSRVRPQVTDSAFLAHRVRINSRTNPSSHPFAEAVNSWEIKSSMLNLTAVANEPEIKYIVTEDELIQLASTLDKEEVMAFDTESHSHFCYLSMVCLLQISTSKIDYIIDCLKLYDKINIHMQPIFCNPNKLKIVHDITDCVAIQRDFGIFSVGVLDTQEVFSLRYPKEGKISFSKMVKFYFGVELNKLPQLADWRKRPLHNDLVKYAAQDSRLLLRCWQKLKAEFNNELDMSYNTLDLEEFPKSKAGNLKLYSFPKGKTVPKLWRVYIDSLTEPIKTVFNIQSQYDLFAALTNWRLQTAKALDLPPELVLALPAIGKICRFLPIDLASVKSIVGASYNINVSQEKEIVQIVNEYRPSMFTDSKRVLPVFDSPSPASGEITKEEVVSLLRKPNPQVNIDFDDWESDFSGSELLDIQQATNHTTYVHVAKPIVANSLPTIKKKAIKKKRNGKELKVKRVFFFAQKIGLTMADLLQYQDKFPKCAYVQPNQ
ncbi:unnamed protein product [Orchesella dallaii]